MINAIEVYQDAGRKAARAHNVGDRATVLHWQDWLNKALRLEGADREKARDAFNAAYRATTNHLI